MQNEIIITAEGILWILGAIVAIGGATAVVSRWLTPFRNLKTEVEELKTEVAAIKGSQKGDHKELEKLEESNEKICRCVLAITDHELTGNSVERLREARDEMQNYLISK